MKSDGMKSDGMKSDVMLSIVMKRRPARVADVTEDNL